MATKKTKKDINQFKQALLSNAGFIKEIEDDDPSSQRQEPIGDVVIDNEVREKFQVLAEYEGVDEKELINKALKHYLNLKGLQLKQALKKKRA